MQSHFSYCLFNRFFLCLFFSFASGFAVVVGCSDSPADSENPTDSGTDTIEAAGSARIYASMAATNKVIVIDEARQSIVSEIPVGKGPAILVATPDQKKIYSANWADNTVSAIEVATEAVTHISTPGRPYVIAMAPDGRYVYTGCASNPPEISVINTESDTIEKHFTQFPELPASIIVSRPEGETLYVAMLNITSGLVGTFQANSASTGELIQESLTVGMAPAWITITPDGSKVYTLNFYSDDISVVDTSSWSVTATISTGPGTRAIIGHVTPDNSKLYVTNHGTGELAAIDTSTNQIVKTIDIGARPVGVNFNRDGSRVYVTDFGPESLEAPLDANYLLSGEFTPTGNGRVSIFDEASGELIGRTIVDPGATSVAVIE